MSDVAAAKFWDRMADYYSKRPFPRPEVTERKFAVMRPLLGARVLDIGCSSGTILLALAGAMGEGEGIDVSPAMVAIANQRLAEAGVKNLQFRVLPASGLGQLSASSYSCVSAFNILNLVADPALVIQAIFLLLKPGGVLVTSTPCLGGTWFPPYGLIVSVLHWLGKAPAVTLFSREELIKMLEEVGFVDIVTHEVGDNAINVFLTAKKPAS